MFNFHRVCELWCGQSNGSISIFTICENIVTSHEIVNHYEPVIDNINVMNIVSTHCPLYHEGDDLTVCSYVYPGKIKCKFSLLRSYMPISSWLPTLWVQLPLFKFGVYLWHPWNVETFWFVSFISIFGCRCLKSIAIQDTGIKHGIPNRTLKPVFMMHLSLVYSSVNLLFVFYFLEILLMRCRSCIILYLYDTTSWFYIIAMLIVDEWQAICI